MWLPERYSESGRCAVSLLQITRFVYRPVPPVNRIKSQGSVKAALRGCVDFAAGAN